MAAFRPVAVFSGLGVREHFELSDLVDVHGGELAAVGASVDVGDAVHHEVVLVVAIAIDGSADATCGDDAWNGAGEIEEGAGI